MNQVALNSETKSSSRTNSTSTVNDTISKGEESMIVKSIPHSSYKLGRRRVFFGLLIGYR